MSTLDPMAGVAVIARALAAYKGIRVQADPDLACMPVLVPSSVEGLVLCLDSDTANEGRRIEPRVVVFHAETETSTRYVTRSYPMHQLRWRTLSPENMRTLRSLARISDPDALGRFYVTRPIRHAI